MPKRIADNQLNHENWDEEETEDTGLDGQVGIPVASADELKGRVIKVAKRKGIAGAAATSDSAPGKSAFAGFSGFGSLKPTSASFSSLVQPMKTEPRNGVGSSASSSAELRSTALDSAKPVKSDEYYSKLRALNESVSAWIKQHVDKNPYCILSPVFTDYEKHLAGVEKLNTDTDENGAGASAALIAGKSTDLKDENENRSKHVSFNLVGPTHQKKAEESTAALGGKPAFSFTTSNASPASTFSFGLKKNETESETKPAVPKFGFNASTSTDSSTTPKFTFNPSGGVGSTSGFSFGGVKSGDSNSVKPFSFATGGTTTSTPSAGTTGGDDDEYVPPKVEVKEIKEEGATYTKRCKLFWMKDGDWKDKGLGNLHLKPLESGRTQLIIRADTNLGTILLNIKLSGSIPTSRSGKNMVTMVCLPNPPFEQTDQPKPVKLLLKVKTSDDADELLSKLDEAKN